VAQIKGVNLFHQEVNSSDEHGFFCRVKSSQPKDKQEEQARRIKYNKQAKEFV
jgi:hypothetical protein